MRSTRTILSRVGLSVSRCPIQKKNHSKKSIMVMHEVCDVIEA